MSDTPRYVLDAVRTFIEDDKRESLVGMFLNGIPLHSYPESRELIEKLLREEALRGVGQGLRNHGKEIREYRALLHLAELKGGGVPVKSEKKDGSPDGLRIVSKMYGIGYWKLYDEIWKPNKNREDVLRQIELGKLAKKFSRS